MTQGCKSTPDAKIKIKTIQLMYNRCGHNINGYLCIINDNKQEEFFVLLGADQKPTHCSCKEDYRPQCSHMKFMKTRAAKAQISQYIPSHDIEQLQLFTSNINPCPTMIKRATKFFSLYDHGRKERKVVLIRQIEDNFGDKFFVSASACPCAATDCIHIQFAWSKGYINDQFEYVREMELPAQPAKQIKVYVPRYDPQSHPDFPWELTIPTGEHETLLRRALRVLGACPDTPSKWRLTDEMMERIVPWLKFSSTLEKIRQAAKVRHEKKEERRRLKKEQEQREAAGIFDRPVYKPHIRAIDGTADGYFTVSFHDVPDEHRGDAGIAYATLRRAIRSYRHRKDKEMQWREYYNRYWKTDTNGSYWKLTDDTILEFEDWFVFSEPLEEMLKRAREIGKKRKQEEELRRQSWEREYRRFYASMRPASQIGSALAIFGFDDTPTQDEVKKRYRILAKQYHPDLGGDAEKFKQLNNANQVLMQHFA